MVSRRSLHHIRWFYAAYFAAMGLVLPFFPVYLADRGLDVAMIGIMTGLLAAAKVIAPPAVGWLLDRRSEQQMRYFIMMASLLAALAAAAMSWSQETWTLALLVLLFGCLWAAILPLTDGLSVAVSEAALADYGRLRVWGSVGFIVASVGGGVALVGEHMHALPLVLGLLMLGTALAASGFPHLKGAGAADSGHAPFPAVFYVLLGVSFLMQVSHGAYYGFFSLYLADAGYEGWQIGLYWVLGVVAEIVLMWRWSRPLQRAAPARLFSVCLLLAAIRWLGTGLTTDAWLLLALQCLHAASFAAFHVAAIAWVRRLTPARRQATAQGWYSASGFGLGSTIGIMGCGLVVESFGFPAAFALCAGIALLGIPLARLLPAKGRG